MAPKKRGRSSTPPIASGSSPRKKPRKSEEEEAEAKSKKEEKATAAKSKKAQKKAESARKKAFKESLIPWTTIHNFTFPNGTPKINKGDAKTTYKLNDTEMATLPYEKMVDRTIRTTHFYSLADVKELARRKRGDSETAASNDVRPTAIRYPSSRTTAAMKAEDRRKQQTAASDYDKALVKCLEYFLPAYEQGPDTTYTPPSGSSSTLPDNFAFRPGRRITELEAMNLFLLNRHELQGLEQQPQDPGMPVNTYHFGNTLDYEAVQQRAMDVHGGLQTHNALITQTATQYTSDPQSFFNWPKYPPYLHHELALAPNVIRHRHSDLSGKALIEVWWPPLDFRDEDDFGAREVCAPGQCRGPNPNVPYECIPVYDPGAKYPWME
ncbi:hypothetical protein BDZ89DRAFT_1058467 [Hymenopellis radicata]|nr:hypothetical protein BDZ89DRAFT_1058467 [Hymenopellis radicata]